VPVLVLPWLVHPPAWQTWPFMQGVGAPQVWQPPAFVAVQVRSAPFWHSLAPGSQSSEQAGEVQTPLAQVCPAAQGWAGDHSLQGALP
jgi:hypothetical protein